MIPGLTLLQNSALAAVRIGRASTSAALAATMMAAATMMTGAAATF